MYQIICINLIVTLFSLCLFSFPALGADLELEVAGKYKQPEQAVLKVALYKLSERAEEHKNWEHVQHIRKISLEPSRNKSNQFTISELDTGQLCIKLFVDLNENGLLDRSSNGLPIEPVGFANNPSLFLGEPSPDKTCFHMDQENNFQIIELKQNKSKKKRKSKS